MAESQGKPPPEPMVPGWIRAAWHIWGWITWPRTVREMKRAGFRRTGWMTWETGPPDDIADLTAACLSSDQLAQYRGCDLANDCYSECCQVAHENIADNTDPGELRQAAAWAATQTWA